MQRSTVTAVSQSPPPIARGSAAHCVTPGSAPRTLTAMTNHAYRIPLLLIGVAILLAGCGEEAPDADFTFVSADSHNTLDPQRMSWSRDIRMAEQLYAPLVEFDFEKSKPVPATAKDWSLSDDRRTYTFHIREDAKWSNGDPVTANHYLYAWRRALLPSFSANYISLLYRIEGAKQFNQWRVDQLEKFAEISDKANGGGASGQTAAQETWRQAKRKFKQMVGLSAPDKHTLKVTLKRPVPYFLQLVAFPTFSPVHAPSVKEATTLQADTGRFDMDTTYWSDPDRLVTNGPYHIAKAKPGRYLYLEANEHYYGRDTMNNSSVLERMISDPNSQMVTYEDGRADWLPDLPAQNDAVIKKVQSGRDDVHKFPMAGTYFYNFNCNPDKKLPSGEPNPLAKTKVRRALSMAIDRKRLVNRITQLGQPVARTFVPPDAIPDYQPPVDAGVRFDPERARQLLAEAGYPEGEGLSGLSLLYNTDGGHQSVAAEVQRMWRSHLNVEVNTEGIPSTRFAERLDNGKFWIARAGWIGDYPDPTTWLTTRSSDSQNNDANWSNQRYDQLLEKAATQQGQTRMQTLRKAERVLVEEQPMALLYFYVNVDMFDPKRVRGIEPTPWPRWQIERFEVNSAGGGY